MQPKPQTDFGRDLLIGLSQKPKRMYPKYLYDDIGSALFEVITLLPEYCITRAEVRLLERIAADVASHLSAKSAVCELGGGRGAKARHLLAALAERDHHVDYFPVDISRWALDETARAFEGMAHVETHPVQGTYLDGLEEIERKLRAQPLLVLFLGSNMGNFEFDQRCDFIKKMGACLKAGDSWLMGLDLVKPLAVLNEAYDDPIGVTSAFTKNALARVNREFGANFDVRGFEHNACWNAKSSRMELGLISVRAQRVWISDLQLEVEFEQGERLITEYSYKFSESDVNDMAQLGGFRVEHLWIDEHDLFCEALLVKEPPRQQ